MTKIFSGKEFAQEKEKKLIKEILVLKKKRITPKLVSILIGDEKSSKLFLSLKKKAAEKIGAEVEVKSLGSSISLSKIVEEVDRLNKEKTVHGVMVQLPLPDNLKQKTQEIINTIASKKDVDGMRDNSPYLTPTVQAVLEAIHQSPVTNHQPQKVVLVGAKGFIGKKLVKVLEEMGYQVEGVDVETKDLKLKTNKADILISATGRKGMIKKDMVKQGSVVIDVGAPYGDVQFKEVSTKASFITPVPGGIGPVTISFLLENLLIAFEGSLRK